MKTLLITLAALALSISHGAEPSKAPEPQYVYHAEAVRVVDGGTLVMNIDLGFHVWLHDETLRLKDIAVPDLKGAQKEEAIKWREALGNLLEGHKLIIKTSKDKSPNPPTRFLVTIWADDVNVNEALLKAVK